MLITRRLARVTTYGIIGIKVWIYKGKFGQQTEEQAGGSRTGRSKTDASSAASSQERGADLLQLAGRRPESKPQRRRSRQLNRNEPEEKHKLKELRSKVNLMAMMPKRVKYRKSQRGKMKGNATRLNYVAFGEYGLQSLEMSWVTARQIEAGRVAAATFWTESGKVYIRIFPANP